MFAGARPSIAARMVHVMIANTPSNDAAAAPLAFRWIAAVVSFAGVSAVCAYIGAHVAEQVAQFAPATCVSFGCYCEADATSGPREAVDAWSSLAPAVAGALLLAFALGPRPSGGTTLARSRTPTMLLSAAASMIAVFSFQYHATHTLIGEWLDATSLYLLAGFSIAWGVARARGLSARRFALLHLLLAGVPAALAWGFPGTRKVAFVCMAVVAVLAEVMARRRATTTHRGGFLAMAVASLGVAGVAWTLDWTRMVCDPDSRLQLHAVWHALSAPTILSLHAYFSSERARVARPVAGGPT